MKTVNRTNSMCLIILLILGSMISCHNIPVSDNGQENTLEPITQQPDSIIELFEHFPKEQSATVVGVWKDGWLFDNSNMIHRIRIDEQGKLILEMTGPESAYWIKRTTLTKIIKNGQVIYQDDWNEEEYYIFTPEGDLSLYDFWGLVGTSKKI